MKHDDDVIDIEPLTEARLERDMIALTLFFAKLLNDAPHLSVARRWSVISSTLRWFIVGTFNAGALDHVTRAQMIESLTITLQIAASANPQIAWDAQDDV